MQGKYDDDHDNLLKGHHVATVTSLHSLGTLALFIRLNVFERLLSSQAVLLSMSLALLYCFSSVTLPRFMTTLPFKPGNTRK